MSLNSFIKVDPALIDMQSPEVLRSPDGHGGYTNALKALDTKDAMKGACGSASRSFPKGLYIEPKDRAAKARENDENHTWGINYLDRYTNQDPTHECTCHSLRANGEAARNRGRGITFKDGPKKNFRYEESKTSGSVWLAPNSVYPEANPRQRGGAGVVQVLDIACRRGFLPETIQPRDYGFKHAIPGTTGKGGLNQASGPWLPLSRFPDGWQETAKHFKPLEVIITEDFEEALCLVLHGYIVSVGRNGHAVPWAFWNEKDQVMGYVDSYDVVRYDSLRTCKYAAEGGFAIASMTTPDDWMKPAG